MKKYRNYIGSDFLHLQFSWSAFSRLFVDKHKFNSYFFSVDNTSIHIYLNYCSFHAFPVFYILPVGVCRSCVRCGLSAPQAWFTWELCYWFGWNVMLSSRIPARLCFALIPCSKSLALLFCGT